MYFPGDEASPFIGFSVASLAQIKSNVNWDVAPMISPCIGIKDSSNSDYGFYASVSVDITGPLVIISDSHFNVDVFEKHLDFSKTIQVLLVYVTKMQSSRKNATIFPTRLLLKYVRLPAGHLYATLAYGLRGLSGASARTMLSLEA